MFDYHTPIKLAIIVLFVAIYQFATNERPPSHTVTSTPPVPIASELPIENEGLKHVMKGSVWTFPVGGNWTIEVEDGRTKFFLHQGNNSILNYESCTKPGHRIYIVHDVFSGTVWSGDPDECGLKLLMQPLIAEELARYTLSPTPINKHVATKIGDYNIRSDLQTLIITSKDKTVVYTQRKLSEHKWKLDWVEEGRKATIEISSIRSYPVSSE